MQAVLTYFDPQPAPAELPVRLSSPFAHGPPHALARRAAEELRLHLRRGDLGGGLELRELEAPGGGKMFGVLVVAAPDGRIGYLRAFSGMLAGHWQVDGFAPPLFDQAMRDTFWPAGQAELSALGDRHAALREGADPVALRASLVELEHLRAGLSRQLWQQLSYTYVIPNARGEERPLGALFAPAPPPGGAGDCAAPKLLAHAYRHHLRPLALAEFWWGAPPLTGERHAGEYYPACRGKCGRVLPYMLEGLSVEASPLLEEAAGVVEDPRVVHEDPWVLVVDKPRGLLSVPGRHSPGRDSVLVRLRRKFPEESGLHIVHPLDFEASGLMLVARAPEIHAALQRQFARSEAHARYVAWLDGHVTGDQGVVELPLRSDADDRPRHIVDPLHGKRAITEWCVTQRSGTRTRVALIPRTARTHQLRVHAAHPLGLGAPIVGDLLYGGDGTRLMLHAEAVTFIHPRTGERIDIESLAPDWPYPVTRS
ncbi:RluA family pseudouridine synthase [Archangium lipolyticum]|uniref:RluA family pseudouridine synthase n=1 Tax=Archangium lipolyticum TaxID=2970465 RepID=UPI00214A383A|nr:RluA family pseudouridine synthase [Archangium lipolyticum]